jgi:hypothetical protein
MDHKLLMRIINQDIEAMLPHVRKDETLMVTTQLINGQSIALQRIVPTDDPEFVIIRGHIRNNEGKWERASALLPLVDIRLVLITAALGLRKAEKKRLGFPRPGVETEAP